MSTKVKRQVKERLYTIMGKIQQVQELAASVSPYIDTPNSIENLKQEIMTWLSEQE